MQPANQLTNEQINEWIYKRATYIKIDAWTFERIHGHNNSKKKKKTVN